jgi:hypothetical protein
MSAGTPTRATPATPSVSQVSEDGPPLCDAAGAAAVGRLGDGTEEDVVVGVGLGEDAASNE